MQVIILLYSISLQTDAESLTCCEYDKVFDENTRAKVIANATDEENTSSDDAIGVGARNGISKTDADSQNCSEYDDVFDENTRTKVIANATDEENTSSDDAIGVGARKRISKKGKTYHFTNCENVQIGEKLRMDIGRLGDIEKQCTALQQAIQEHKQEIHILREADTQQKQTIKEHQQAMQILQDSIRKLAKSDVENKKTISGLQHSVNIQQEEIQSLKMMVKPNNSIESSPLTNVTNQSKDVKRSSDNVNEEELSDEQNKRKLM
ncbi:hypothetical protein SNE40_004095 [Patella caerulea]|uniref:Uncharacterized protein n=1 Tax=Patella caerulea TaxID=87958 RepID=A0AAN8K9A0_PATCE